MKRLVRTLTFVIVALGMTIIPVTTVGAQQAENSESITLSPVSRKYTLDAGATTKDSMTVINDGKVAYDFLVYSRPYSVTNENYEPNFTRTAPNTDAYSWVQLEKTRFHLEPGASTTVDYTLHVPPKAAPGGHYGVIFAETQPSQQQATGNAVIRKKRVGTLIYATVNGKVITEGQVQSTAIPFWQQQPPLEATARVKNTGNTDFTDDTTLTVKDVFGNTKYQATKQYVVLPDTTRKIALQWPGSSWFGLYKVDVTQTVLGKQSQSSGYVLVMPRYIIVLIGVIVIAGGAYAWLRRTKK